MNMGKKISSTQQPLYYTTLKVAINYPGTLEGLPGGGTHAGSSTKSRRQIKVWALLPNSTGPLDRRTLSGPASPPAKCRPQPLLHRAVAGVGEDETRRAPARGLAVSVNTATDSYVITDPQAWRTPHEDVRGPGCRHFGHYPLVPWSRASHLQLPGLLLCHMS